MTRVLLQYERVFFLDEVELSGDVARRQRIVAGYHHNLEAEENKNPSSRHSVVNGYCKTFCLLFFFLHGETPPGFL